MNLTNYPYRFSYSRNKFITIGCETLAYISISNRGNDYQSGCVSVCNNLSLADLSCSGIGCCQTAIPKGISYYYVWFDGNFNNSDVYEFNPCSYGVLAEDSSFSFDTKYITTDALSGQQMPLVLDWAIRNEKCNIALENPLSYMCKSENSVCLNSTNDVGYFCNCSLGYQGNPYLVGGCEDIDECADKNNNPCSKPAECHNTVGGYRCSCPFGMRLNPDSHENCQLDVPVLIGMSIGAFLLFSLLFSLLICMYLVRERRKLKKVREKYFQQHGGWELYDEIKANQGIGITVFTKQELEHATSKFDNAQIVGQGGFGTVYKGELKDRTVAIKKCKITNENQRKEFGKEMLILSQINHKNIVKLLGFCLEVEVPMLVYEYITNGTLYQYIKGKNGISSISLEIRLRIAQESAEALAYLHSSASPPIIHGDVKSTNILLDENFTVKISDFGASVLALADESHFVTVVQGTRGYLDPEYLINCELTSKSDVYSFGVILLELLTRKPPICFDETDGEGKCLSSIFLSALKENQLNEMLDEQIKNHEDMEIITQVADLAKECLNIKGDERPTMKEVAENLDRIIKLKQHPWGQYQPEEVENLLGEASGHGEMEISGYFSLEKKAVRDIESGR
ncbi:hypothetical protein LUZ60_016468 [Juncus effusus]|nr:hypothetical protein LUZ60_016468 [Juncus effusus]